MIKKHKQTRAYKYHHRRNGYIMVDVLMKGILEKIWKMYINTDCSCQGTKGKAAYISFPDDQGEYGEMPDLILSWSNELIEHDIAHRITVAPGHSTQLEFAHEDLGKFEAMIASWQ